MGMIQYVFGNLLECKADALVNTVNCVGVMGRGISTSRPSATGLRPRINAALEPLRDVRVIVFEPGLRPA